MPTYCKINTTAYNPNKKVATNERWPFHNQVLNTPELYREMIQALFAVERDTDPGVDMDSYMVVYEDQYELYREWFKYNGMSIKRGKFYVIYEKRNGGNYQMFNLAYQLTRHRYDWYLFTCDDIVVFGDQYYQKILDRWDDGCGYIALQGGGEILPEEVQHHVQGSIGLTSGKILEQVCAINNGELPHAKDDWKQESNIHQGEIPFTNKILGLGYHFTNYNDSQEWKKDNLCFPYYNYIRGYES